MTVSEAIATGILDQGKGTYVNTRTGDSMQITQAIEQGLIIADIRTKQEETQAAEPDSKILSQREVTCTITSVRHPITGKCIGYRYRTENIIRSAFIHAIPDLQSVYTTNVV